MPFLLLPVCFGSTLFLLLAQIRRQMDLLKAEFRALGSGQRVQFGEYQRDKRKSQP